MSRITEHGRRTYAELLSTLQNNNIDELSWILQALQGHHRGVLDRNLKYFKEDQQRMFSSLLAAIDLSSTEIVKLIISKGANVNKKGYSMYRRTASKNVYVPLCLACRSERTDLIPLLVEAGADLNCGGGEQLVPEEEGGSIYMEGVYPLLTFCLLYSTPPVYVALLYAGADPCAALSSIALHGYQPLDDRMRTLLQAGAFLEKETVDITMVEYLLDSGFIDDTTIMEITWNDLRLAIDANSSQIRQFIETQTSKYNTESKNKGDLLRVAMISGPETLKCVCRSVIRHTLGKIKLFHKIDSLTLPSLLKKFLLFGYVNPNG